MFKGKTTQLLGRVLTFDELVHYLETGYPLPSPYTSHADWACSLWNHYAPAVDALAQDMSAHRFLFVDQAGKLYHKLMHRYDLQSVTDARIMYEKQIGLIS